MKKDFAIILFWLSTIRGASVAIQITSEGSLIQLAIFLHASRKGNVDPVIVSFGSLH